MTDDRRGWRIESRQNGVLWGGGHNFLALIDPEGRVREEIHGWKNDKGRMSGLRIKDGQIVDGAPHTQVLWDDIQANRLPEASVEVSLGGRDVHEVWSRFLESRKRHHDTHRYDPSGQGYDPKTNERFYNSNSFWRSVLEENGFDWKMLEPRTRKTTPGTGNPLPPRPDGLGDASDIFEMPVERWTDADVRGLMRSSAYWSRAYPGHAELQDKVRDWYVRQYDV